MSEIIFDERQLAEQLGKTIADLSDLSPIMDDIGEIVLLSIDDNFEAHGRYAGAYPDFTGGSQKFAPLAESTKKRKEKRGRDPENILQDSGRLRNAFDYQTQGNTLQITNNVDYFPPVTLGTKNGKLPPRPVAVLQTEDIEEITELIVDHLQKK